MLGKTIRHLHMFLYSQLPLLVAVLVLLPLQSDAQFGENPFAVSPELATPEGQAATLTLRFKVQDGHYLYAAQLKVATPGNLLSPYRIPEPKHKSDPFSGEDVGVYDHDFQLVYTVADDTALPFALTVEYQGCSDTLCFMPQTETFSVDASGEVAEVPPEPDDLPVGDQMLLEGFTVTGRESGYKPSAEFIEFIDRVEAGKGLSGNPLREMIAQRGFVVAILAILLGGLALNLTPCVLPMIPVNIAIIGAGSQAGSRARGFALGATYGLGIALVYGVLGIVVVLTGSQFGALNASPWFNLAIATLFFVLSLAMFGVFNIDLSRLQNARAGGNKRSHGPFVTAFIFGGIAALLAGACVAPVLIWVLVLSTEIYQRGAASGLLLPFVLGLGMALPWPFAGAGLSFLPKPGQWMERIKLGFGIIILAAAAYYGQLGVRMLAPSDEPKQATGTSEMTWLTSLDAAMEESRATGKPIFVDVWATWCKSCKVMSKTTLRDPDVVARLEPYVPLKYQAEEPKAPETRRVLDALGVKGQPFYVVLQPE